MTPDEQEQFPPFVDPELKAAACRAWGLEKAPPSLRARAERLMQASSVPEKASARKSPRAPQTMRQHLMWPAVAVIGVILFFQIRTQLPQSPVSPPPKLTVLPSQLYAQLIARHQRCSQLMNHHALTAAETDDAAIAKDMQAKLSQAVLMARPTGWFFRGAAICYVGPIPTGHLLFGKGVTTLSIFSLPQSVAPGLTNDCKFETTNDGHAIASFSKNGGLFCIVGNDSDGRTSLSQLVDLRTKMEAAVTPSAGCATCHPAPTGELTYAISP